METGDCGEGRRGAFTLIEVMLVVAIIGLIAAIAVPRMVFRMDEAQTKTTRVQIRELESAIDMFRLDNGTYPASLADLVVRPADARTWPTGGYLKEVPRDAWGNEFVYAVPGARGLYDVISYGGDGQPGGEGANADLTN
jgi:general secretion pathway protein G